MTSYSRQNPSPRYSEHIQLNTQMHEKGDEHQGLPPKHVFQGRSLFTQLPLLKPLIELKKPRTLLDYGAGKGLQYHPDLSLKDGTGKEFKGVIDFLGLESVTGYDPCYTPHSTLPEGRFDGVISTDVVEHCPEEDLPWIIREMFSYAHSFVFVSIAGYPAMKTLPNGENAHITLKPIEWWAKLVSTTATDYPGVDYLAIYETKVTDASGAPKKRQQMFAPPHLDDALRARASAAAAG